AAGRATKAPAPAHAMPCRISRRETRFLIGHPDSTYELLRFTLRSEPLQLKPGERQAQFFGQPGARRTKYLFAATLKRLRRWTLQSSPAAFARISRRTQTREAGDSIKPGA